MGIQRQICKLKDKNFTPTEGVDLLELVFDNQKRFMDLLGLDIKAMSQADREKLIKECCLASIAENIELLEETNWKPWKKTKKKLDLEQARFEIVDDLCFLIEKALALGMDAKMLCHYHQRKVEINEERQKNNY